MPSKTNSETRGAILAHHHYGLSSREIVLKMAEMGTSVSKSTVARAIKKKKIGARRTCEATETAGDPKLTNSAH
jgi:transposase-like protein